jgi:hypothetical protein
VTRKKLTPAERDAIKAARRRDRDAYHDALIERQRDPARWFCSGRDGEGMARVYGSGETQKEAEANARESARRYIADKKAIHKLRGQWTFTSYAPTPDWKK